MDSNDENSKHYSLQDDAGDHGLGSLGDIGSNALFRQGAAQDGKSTSDLSCINEEKCI